MDVWYIASNSVTFVCNHGDHCDNYCYINYFAFLLSFRPFGAQIKPFLEMMAGPSGGQSVQDMGKSQQQREGGTSDDSKR